MMESQQKIQYTLVPKHQEDLKNSGLTDEQIQRVGHFSGDKETTEKLVGYRLPGLIFHYNDPQGNPYLRSDGKPFYRIKPDWGDLKTENSPKYLSPRGEGCRPYLSILYRDWEKAIQSVKTDLWETEGEKKGDCGCTNGLATIAFAGVDGWVDSSPRDGEEQLSKSRTLPELDKIKWNDRRVYQCFDSDIIEKIPVQKALAKRAFVLTKVGAFPHLVLLPNEIDGSKNGLDDFVVRHGIEALKILARGSEPTSFKLAQGNNEDTDLKITLCLKEPDTHYKSLMATSVLKDIWAFRPGVGWYEWKGKYWKLCTCVEFEETLVRFMDAQKWKKRSSAIMTSIIRELQSRLMVKDDYWNPNCKLAFSNGTLKLMSDEFYSGHIPRDYITRVRPYNYTDFASVNWREICPTWMKFLDEATGGNPEIIELLRAWLKYVLMPKPKDRKAEIEKSLDLFGAKGTGKGTFLDVMIQLVGIENTGPASPDTFKSGKDLGQLIDKDLAVDTDCSGFLGNVGVYNKVVSNEPVEVKKLYKDPYTARLCVVVVRAYNAHIQVPNASEGLDRRLTVIPFQHQPKVIDHGLSTKLKGELSEIFAWVWHLSIQEMRDRILTSGSIGVVAQASIERFAADNPEYQFLLEEFPKGHTLIKAGDLYERYSDWCKNNNYKAIKTHHKFAPSIQKLGCKRRDTKHNGCYYYNIPDMSQFDIAGHLGINPQYLGYSRPSGDLKQDISNPHLEGNRDICRPCLEKSCYIENQVSLDLLNQQHTNSFPNIPNVSMPLYIDTSDEYERSKQGLESTLDISIVGSPPLDWQPMIGEHIEAKKYKDTFHPGTIDAVPTKHSNPSKSTSFWKITFDDGSKGIIWDLINLHRIDKF